MKEKNYLFHHPWILQTNFSFLDDTEILLNGDESFFFLLIYEVLKLMLKLSV